jgi:hypothetical protein
MDREANITLIPNPDDFAVANGFQPDGIGV